MAIKTARVSFDIDIDEEAVDELKRAVDHHMESLVDLEGWPEIHYVHNARVETIKEGE